jgi:hypothetical protein
MFDKTFSNKNKNFLILVTVFAFNVIIYGLSFSILNSTETSASIAVSQFAGDGVSLKGIFAGLIGLCAFNLFILIWFFIVGLIIKYWSFYFLSSITLLFNLISEAIFFKFASCFSFPSNSIVVARSSLVILFMTIMLCVALFSLVHYLLHHPSLDDSWKEISGALLELLFILSSIALIALNAILIARLKPQLNYYIQPSSLRMGFFNSLEMSQIQNGSYVKTNTFDQQLIGNLGDVVYSPNLVLARKCGVNNADCYSNTYLNTYLYQIPCTNQNVLFYKDCAFASGLTFYVTYLDIGSYPSYNCFVNRGSQKCGSVCTQLLSNYQLIVIQEIKPNQVQAAWTGLSSCYTNINIQLTHDSTLNPCASQKFR